MRNWSRRSLSDAPRPKAAVVSSPEPRSTRSVGADKAKLTRLEREEKLVHSIVQRLAASLAPAGALSDAERSKVVQARQSLSACSSVVVLPSLLRLLEDRVTTGSLDAQRSQLVLLDTILSTLHRSTTSRSIGTTESRSSSSRDPAPLDERSAVALLSLCMEIMREQPPHARLPIAPATRESIVEIPSIDSLSREALHDQIFQEASKVLRFLSSSNWAVVLARIKRRALVAGEENEEQAAELHLIDCCTFDQERLSALLQEIGPKIVHLRRPLQITVAALIRRAVTSWREHSPTEFASFLASSRRLEGADALFDSLQSLVDGHEKRRSYGWPALMSLLALLPDAIAAGHAHSRTTQFIESFRRALKAGKVVAVECCVDLLGMAHASDDPASVLVKFAGGMGPDLKLVLLGKSKGTELPPVGLLTRAWLSLPRDDESLMLALNEATPTPHRLAALDACAMMQDLPVPHLAIALHAALVGIESTPALCEAVLKIFELRPALFLHAGPTTFDDRSEALLSLLRADGETSTFAAACLAALLAHVESRAQLLQSAGLGRAVCEYFVACSHVDAVALRLLSECPPTLVDTKPLEAPLLLATCSGLAYERQMASACLRSLLEPDNVLIATMEGDPSHPTWFALSRLQSPTPGLINAFESGVRRWQQLRTTLLDGGEGIDRTAVLASFAQLTPFLVAALTPCRHAVPVNERLIERFIKDLVDLLASTDVGIYDVVESSLTLISPDVLRPVLRVLTTTIAGFVEKPTSIETDTRATFLERTVSLLSRVDLSGDDAGLLARLLLSAVWYVSRMGRSDSALALRTELCRLLASGQRTYQEGEVSRDLYGHLVHWHGQTSASSGRPSLAALARLAPPAGDNAIRELFPFLLHLLPSTAAFHESHSHVIAALANLLRANLPFVGCRLREMSLHPDPSLRTACLETLSLFISHGVSLADLQSPSETRNKMVELLRAPDLSLALAMCEAAAPSEYPTLFESLFNIFSLSQQTTLIKAMLENEVRRSNDEATLLRGNTCCTRFTTSFARRAGYRYLRTALQDLIADVVDSPPDFSLPFDARHGDISPEVARRLEEIIGTFLASLSADQVPAPLREICSHIGKVVGDRFPSSVYTSIGGFIFLRVVCPAIVAPETIGFVLPEKENPNVRRGLVWISKIVQSLSNFRPSLSLPQEFGLVVARYLVAVSHFDPDEEPSIGRRPEETESLVREEEALRGFLVEHQDKIKTVLSRPTDPTPRHWHDEFEPVDANAASQTSAELSALIGSAVSSLASPSFSDFVRERSTRPLAPELSEIFYAVPDAPAPTFCIVLGKIDANSTDCDALLYFALTTIAEAHSSCDLVVDCTNFGVENGIPRPCIARLFDLPSVRTSRVILYRPTSGFVRYLRDIPVDKMDSRHGALAVSTALELSRLLGCDLTFLPFTTTNLTSELRTSFDDGITELSRSGDGKQVRVEVGSHSIQITSRAPVLLFADVSSRTIDSIGLAEVDDVQKFSWGIEISYWGRRATTQLAVEEDRRDELFMALLRARTTPLTLLIRPSPTHDSALATLQNGVLVGLSSANAEVRERAFGLACSLAQLTESEGYEGSQAVAGVCPPLDPAFVASVAQKFASTATAEHVLALLDEFTYACGSLDSTELATYVHAVRPWVLGLFNFIPRSDMAAIHGSLKRFARQLTILSLRDPIVHSILLSRILPAVGKIDILVAVFLDETVDAAVSLELNGSTKTGLLAQNIVALGGSLLGPVLARLRRVILRAARGEWPEMSALFQFAVSLSFRAPTQAAMYLPEVMSLYTVTSTASISTHARQLLSNVIHAILETNEATDSTAAQAYLQSLSVTLDDAGFVNVVSTLLALLATAAPSLDQANAWRSRWTSLVAASCFQRSPSQANLFVVLAAQGIQGVDGDLVFQIISVLRTALGSETIQIPLLVAVLGCLTSTVPSLVTESETQFFSALSWIVISLLQIGHESISRPAITLLHVTLDALTSLGVGDIGIALHEARNSNIAPELDLLSSVDFTRSFSISLATLLLPFIGDGPAVALLLEGLLEKSPKDSTGFLILLLATPASDEHLRRYPVAKVADTILLSGEDTIMLAYGLLVALATRARGVHDSERVGICHLLLLLSEARPEMAASYVEVLDPSLRQYLSAFNPALADVATRLLLSAIDLSELFRPSDPRLSLSSLGFPSLLDIEPQSASVATTEMMDKMVARARLTETLIVLSLA